MESSHESVPGTKAHPWGSVLVPCVCSPSKSVKVWNVPLASEKGGTQITTVDTQLLEEQKSKGRPCFLCIHQGRGEKSFG